MPNTAYGLDAASSYAEEEQEVRPPAPRGRGVGEPDSALLRACRVGDRRAWEALVRKYQRLLYAIPLRCGLSEDDAADVFQTVCVRLLENIDRLVDERHLTGWLILTARREAWRLSKQKGRSVSLEPAGSEVGEDRLQDLPDPGFLPQESVVRLEEEQLVRVGVSELGERCRTLLGWLYHTDPAVPYAEIARRMNVPIGAIGPTRARCLQQLKKILERMGF